MKWYWVSKRLVCLYILKINGDTSFQSKTKGSLINQTDHRDCLATEEIQISLLCSGGEELRRGQTLIANDVIYL